MKTSFKLLSILLLITFFGCSTTGNSNSSSNQDEDKIVIAKDLPYHIDSLPRLSVRGSGNNVSVQNTSSSTIMGETRPLFVLDGIQMGRELSQIMQLLSPQQELTVDFLSTRMGTIRYGESGKNGVIMINRVSKN